MTWQQTAFEGEQTLAIVGVLALYANQDFGARAFDGRRGFDADKSGDSDAGVFEFGHRLATEAEDKIVLSFPGELMTQTDPAERMAGLATESE